MDNKGTTKLHNRTFQHFDIENGYDSVEVFDGEFSTSKSLSKYKGNSKPAVIFIMLWNSLMFCQIFLSPQVKRCAINTCNHGICELPHELPNDLRLRILEN